ncbi:MAG: hypothetical protein CM1200mP29_12910 [Verrucomicrobiota bacterium]|nr:MAG: hypothetical protein CM1200mP29_12910 [Verrucomicrobiota bacterium]
MISDPKVTVIDTRNDYEVEMGRSAARSIPRPGIRRVGRVRAKNLDPEKHPKIAMFCTGGIRCEKARPTCSGEASRMCSICVAAF